LLEIQNTPEVPVHLFPRWKTGLSMTRYIVPFVAAAVCLAPIALAEGSLSAVGAQGLEGVVGTADSGTIAVRPQESVAVSIQVPQGLVRVLDDHYQMAVHLPGNGSAAAAAGLERTLHEVPLRDARLMLGAVTDSDAIVLVMPASSRFATRFENNGRYSVSPVEDIPLEDSHLYDDHVGSKNPAFD
jgi:hypothetical protein